MRTSTHLWHEGPGPYPHSETTFPRAVDTLCGIPIRRDGRFVIPLPASVYSVELVVHLRDERGNYCNDCLRELAAHPYRCPACANEGGLLCKGVAA